LVICKSLDFLPPLWRTAGTKPASKSCCQGCGARLPESSCSVVRSKGRLTLDPTTALTKVRHLALENLPFVRAVRRDAE
jgi:hypothetical protein